MTDNIGIVHDWLVGRRGGERVVEEICAIFPRARLHALVHKKGACGEIIEGKGVSTSFIQRLPLGVSRYQWYLPLFPEAFRSIDLRPFDLVISSSSAGAKAIRTRREALHLCYCHTPMRYIWDQYVHYFGPGRASLPVRAAMGIVRGRLQRWDIRTAGGVDSFAANSRFVAARIRELYGREADVIHPPVDVGRFKPGSAHDGSYLVAGALVPYKRVDVAVEAFNRMGRRLVIVGAGSEEKRLRAMAGKNVAFITAATDEEMRLAYERCRALVVPGEEDFGIVPVEAMACGKPVIAFGRGGVTESVRDGVDGLLFSEQNAGALASAVEAFERREFNAERIAEGAGRFAREVFDETFRSWVERAWEMKRS